MTTKKEFVNKILEDTGFQPKGKPKMAQLMEMMYALQGQPDLSPQPTVEQKAPIEATPENMAASVAAPQSNLAKQYPYRKR